MTDAVELRDVAPQMFVLSLGAAVSFAIALSMMEVAWTIPFFVFGYLAALFVFGAAQDPKILA